LINYFNSASLERDEKIKVGKRNMKVLLRPAELTESAKK